MNVDCGDGPFESPPDHLWLICGEVSVGLLLITKQN